ncbi:TIGR03619 family F420-dependent LLM class oxidoreductase [Microbacterium sp. No. 7]|uniref:TIGR03619 family F420-dependent LLM class oxidoreductase n=1 Tax=Microbacterium sp. No. 7 TaxID=1714373 RepID=UPI0006D0CE66|nr:TIGR03619 family F420-dependent LLM class oxidoreductase [Microbacterium sp. No. 7]
MRVGLNIVPVRAAAVVAAGRAAEAAGYASAWLGEHLLMPARLESDYLAGAGTQPFDLSTPMLDPLLVLSQVSGVTERIRLGVGVYLVPLRHPLLTAKLVATLDALSGGRLDLGFGTGWMREEFDAVGAPFETRGAMLDEMLGVIATLLTQSRPHVSTEHFRVPEIAFEPKPAGSRIIGGGYAPVARRRAAGWDGWYGRLDRLHPSTNGVGGWDIGAVTAFCRAMRERVHAAGRDAGAFAIIGALSSTATREELEELAAAGVDEVVVNPFPKREGRHVGVTESVDVVHEYAAGIALGAA